MSKTVSLLALTFAAAFASAAFAQDTQPPRQGGQGGGYQRMSPEERAAAELKTLKEKLALTDEQATKIEALIKDRGKEMTAAREKAGSDRDAARAASTEINKSFDAKIDAILTAEQKPKMEAYREERRKQMEQRRPPSNPQ
jgi:periplasmic protein CpxP/Spy